MARKGQKSAFLPSKQDENAMPTIPITAKCIGIDQNSFRQKIAIRYSRYRNLNDQNLVER